VAAKHLNDDELIKEVENANMQAFKTLVEKHQQNVVNVCLGFTHQKEDAEDLAQEVFIEVFESLSKFRGDSKFSTWIYRIAVNKSLNYLRKNKRTGFFDTIEKIFGNDTKSHNYSSKPYHSDSSFIDEERRKVLQSAIDKLSESQKIAFTLHKIEDFSYQEIADTMKLSLPAVESLIHRAKMKLRKVLVNYYSDKY
jgi:RNA polymerase sigma factor (sigma-70 family)